MDDIRLLSSLQSSPEEGIKSLMDKYVKLVYTIVSARLDGVYSDDEVYEYVSDVFVEVYKSRDRIDLGKGTLKAYICVIAKNKAVDALRKSSSRVRAESIEEQDTDLTSSFSVEDECFDNETREEILYAVNSLKEPDREIIIRKFYFSESGKMIAKHLGMTENAVNVRVHRALKKLKEILC
ncbi:MAG: sigma-70 family RNA polymerase sigma factor [Clostridia bacterium]|nr:sigma-70 family RNA polymerase sigma factor [Clostridia bacterium]